MNKIFLLFCFILSCQFLTAQNLLINGNIITNNSSPEGSKVIIIKNGNKIDELLINKKGNYELKLAFGADYKISFEKAGYITKTVNANTEIPEEVLESNPNFPPIKLLINLYPTVKGVDLSVFEQPVGILSYIQELDDFDFDKEYSNAIKNRIAQTEQAIKHELASHSAKALELERKYAELVHKGQQSFERKNWDEAVSSWTQALEIKPGENDLEQKIASARKEAELENARRTIELQNEETYKLVIASADSLFTLKKYDLAREKYVVATQVDKKATYPGKKIQEIDVITANLAKEKAALEKQLAALETNYKSLISTADQAFETQAYEKAISHYEQALALKSTETYPREMIAKANQGITNLKKQQAAEAEKLRLEEERRNNLRNKYAELIAEADKAFQGENYSLARLKYTEADNLKLNEPYPPKRIREIDDIINSSKYKAKLAEYNKNKTLAEKNKQQKNYASAKVYYQKALSILSIDKEAIELQISEIDRHIEAARLAEIEKAYKQHIDKADKAFREKAYAVARFYYKKALEVKIDDKYASEQLKEVEKNIGERQEKGAEL